MKTEKKHPIIRKVTAFAMAAVMLGGSMTALWQVSDIGSSLAVNAVEYYGDFEYDDYWDDLENAVVITSYTGTSSQVKIPKSIDGRKVIAIGSNSFSENSQITSVTIPDSVQFIDAYAFDDCDQLKTVYIPASVEEIGEYALGFSSDIVVYGTTGSAAEDYAYKYDLIFRVDPNAAVAATKVTLSKTSLSLNVGKTSTLKATVSPSNATNKNVTWSSSNSSIATVKNGKITAKKAGTATITAKTSNGKAATCKVTVKQLPTSVKLSKTTLSLNIGKTYTLKATVSPSNASSKSVTWSSSKKNVATVNSSGKITAKKAGTVTITAKTSNGKKATCKVTVKAQPTSVKLSKSKATVGAGETVTLKATVKPSNANNKKVTWTTSNKKIATVKNGKVTTKKAGTVTITAKTSNGKKATCKITVKKAPTKITFNKTSLNLYVGSSFTLKKTLSHGSASSKITYTSGNKSIATVNSAGKITAKKAGTTTITVKTYNGKTAKCRITVSNKTRCCNKFQKYNGKIYYTSKFLYQGISGNINMSKVGSEFVKLPTFSNNQIDSFIIYDKKIYFVDQWEGTGEITSARLYRCNMNGSGLELLATNIEGDFRIVNSTLVFNTYGYGGKTYRYNIKKNTLTVKSGGKQNLSKREIFDWGVQLGVNKGKKLGKYLFYAKKAPYISPYVSYNIDYYCKNTNNGKIYKIGTGYTPQF